MLSENILAGVGGRLVLRLLRACTAEGLSESRDGASLEPLAGGSM